MLRTCIHKKIISLLVFGISSSLVFAQHNTNQKTEVENNKQNIQLQENSVNINYNNSSNTNPAVNEPSRSAQTGYFYRQQTGNFKTAVNIKPNDAAAWANYYKSERYSNYTKTSNDINKSEQKDLDAIVDEMAKNVPNTYEYNYIRYLNGNHDISLFPYLQKAYELNPNSTELIDEFVAYYELTGNYAAKKEWCAKLENSKEIPDAVMEFDYNMIIALEKNAVLITHGEMDTYPLFIWQTVHNIRPDVIVLYLDLLEKDDYRSRKMREMGIQVSTDIHQQPVQFLEQLAEKLSAKPVYFATTVSPDILKPLQAKLYLTGLAFKFSESGFENLQDIENAWEKKFKKEALSAKIQYGTLAAKMNMNYVPGLILLSEYFKSKGLSEKARLAEELALKLAAEGGKEQQVKVLLNK